MLVGLLLRLVAAVSGIGWFAADDYHYVIEPAWTWLTDPEAPYPGHYRSALLARIFCHFLGVARSLGVEDPSVALRLAYGSLGLWSVLAIPAVHSLTHRTFGARAARSAAWLMAAQALFPRISTRALFGVVAIPPLLWSFVCVDRIRAGATHRPALTAVAAGSLVGLAAMLRFQVGLLYPVLLVAIAWPSHKPSPLPSRWRVIVGFLAGGLLAACAQGLVDVGMGRPPMGTIVGYLRFNATYSSSFGISPWYNYLLQLVAYTIPPATVALAKPLWRAARAQVTVSAALAVFLVAHSLVGHKEDRFLFPILPLLFVLLGAALADLTEGGRWSRRAHRFFWGVNALGLMVALVSDAQRSVTVPLAEIGNTHPSATVMVVGIRYPPLYYLGKRATVHKAKDNAALLEIVGTQQLVPDYIFWRDPPAANVLEELANRGLDCSDAREFKGDWVDRMLLTVNPRRNKRRRPTALAKCQEAGVAARP